MPFPNDTYDTDPATPRYLIDRIFFGARIAFVPNVIGVILDGVRQAKRGEYTRESFIRLSYDMLYHVEHGGGRIHITGLNHLRDNEGPFVIVSNHMSTMETFGFPSMVNQHHSCTFIVKQSLLSKGGFGHIMRAIDAIGVTRENARQDLETVLQRGPEVLATGKTIIVFPEATRQATFSAKRFNSIGVKLAKRAGVKIIPAAIKTNFWGNGMILKDFGRFDWKSRDCYFSFGEPMEITGNGAEQHEECVRFISEHFASWGGVVEKE
ncbi:MAG: hypothetical protein A2Y33_04235 [Spirochaetes bacterium GWF1_51_8]|nr:MAG: hypothetical protein A2Y33_04235 [Spirochaetes bacterium GWF1_51_8]